MTRKIKKWWNKETRNSDVLILNITIIFMGIVLPQTSIWFSKIEWGSVADWVSGLGAIGAIFAVIWQVNKQKNIERALNIINKRPRFSLTTTTSPNNETIVFAKEKNLEGSGYSLNLKKKNSEDAYICIQNISNNVIYNFDLILNYKCGKDKTDFEHWNFKGVYPNQIVTFLPSYWFEDENDSCKIKKIIIRFYSPASEIGYFEVSNRKVNEKGRYNFDEGKYYFLEDAIKEIGEFSKDEMIEDNYELCQLYKEYKNGDKYATLSSTFKELKEMNESL
ncbi:hypothetical protein LB941_06310 [Ligilactobacillus sp. WILCCON 0076]|uniref:Uncharacterized protein n=1 Tax=Ligilactobacillus ubinensis TaxID=2876789 RepID=A0A9X2FKF4_9LACO|nr:hypothetical protein [Ligilactobacillus ubinensis]MCP0886945.1 hypothetical protein [Ligilactobacillus ubinensis]